MRHQPATTYSRALLAAIGFCFCLWACSGDPIEPVSAGAGRSGPADVSGMLDPEPDAADSTTADADPVDTTPADTARDTQPPDRILREGMRGTVTLVIDGDTIHVTVDGWYHRVRLQGINAPECLKGWVDSEEGDQYVCTSDQEYWGLASFGALRDIALGVEVTVTCDREPGEACRKDNYDRFLAFIETDEVDLGEYLARHGHAFSYTAFSSTRRARYCRAEDLAIEEQLGMWGLGDRDEVLSRMNRSTQNWYEDRDQRCAAAIAAED